MEFQMAQRPKDESRNPAGGRGPKQPKQPGGGEAGKQRRSGERDTSRSWVHDKPPLEQNDDPQHSGYSDRETPEADKPGSQPGRSSERPRPTR
jgi:hypothetical protein